MSEPSKPLPAKLIASLIFSNPPECEGINLVDKTISALSEEFGTTDFKSQTLPFNYTRYYCKEMGQNLSRIFISFQNLVERDFLIKAKLYTNKIEKYFSNEKGNRKVNIDPGLLTPENLILASCKNFFQRIYLGSGIYAEVTLIYRRKKYESLPWTFPDYRTDEIKEVLLNIRKILIAQLRKTKNKVT